MTAAGEDNAPTLPREVDRLFPQDGFLRDYLNYSYALTDAAAEMHLLGGLVCLSLCAGHLYRIPFGDDNIYLNVWGVLIGESTYSRKTTIVRKAEKQCRRVVPRRILPEDFTPQALDGCLAQEPNRGLFYSEFGEMLRLLNLDFNAGARERLTKLYDVPDEMSRARAAGSSSVSAPYLVMLAGSTIDWINSALTEQDLRSGFYSRFLFLYAPNKRDRFIAIPPKPDEVLSQRLTRHLKEIATHGGEFTLAAEAHTKYENWLRLHARQLEHVSNPGLIGPFWGRLEIYALKFAALLELSANSKPEQQIVLSADTMKQAIRLADFFSESIAKLFKSELAWSRWDNDRLRVIRVIKAAGGRIQGRDLQRKVNMEPRRYHEVIRALRDQEDLDIDEEKQPSGQVKKFLVLVSAEGVEGVAQVSGGQK